MRPSRVDGVFLGSLTRVSIYNLYHSVALGSSVALDQPRAKSIAADVNTAVRLKVAWQQVVRTLMTTPIDFGCGSVDPLTVNIESSQ